jgi:hypothetical protein
MVVHSPNIVLYLEDEKKKLPTAAFNRIKFFSIYANISGSLLSES